MVVMRLPLGVTRGVMARDGARWRAEAAQGRESSTEPRRPADGRSSPRFSRSPDAADGGETPLALRR